MATSEDKIKAAKEYIESVIDWWSIPQGIYGNHEERRVAAHEEVEDQYECDPSCLKRITDNLDIWIGIPMERGDMPDITEQQIINYALKFHNILESKQFKENGYSYVRDETKRLRDIWYDSF